MAQEVKRGCGYRKIGGLYLVGQYIPVACDRLPKEIGACPICGEGIHFTRSMTEIDAFGLWNTHDNEIMRQNKIKLDSFCTCDQLCSVCYPPEGVSYVMMVGEKFYSPESFIEEALSQGISKRIPFIPKKMKMGQTVVYLAHKKAIVIKSIIEGEGQIDLEGGNTKEYKMGIFAAFRPKGIEKLIWESEADEETLKDLEKRGITPVIIKDGDEDHMSRTRG